MSTNANTLAQAHKSICSINIQPAPRKQIGITFEDCDGGHYERAEQDRIKMLNAAARDEI
jgi:hypothetical protein